MSSPCTINLSLLATACEVVSEKFLKEDFRDHSNEIIIVDSDQEVTRDAFSSGNESCGEESSCYGDEETPFHYFNFSGKDIKRVKARERQKERYLRLITGLHINPYNFHLAGEVNDIKLPRPLPAKSKVARRYSMDRLRGSRLLKFELPIQFNTGNNNKN